MGRDPRLMSLKPSPKVVPTVATRSKDWPFQGPSATSELMGVIISTGNDAGSYHSHWLRASGVNAECSAAREHALLLQVLYLLGSTTA